MLIEIPILMTVDEGDPREMLSINDDTGVLRDLWLGFDENDDDGEKLTFITEKCLFSIKRVLSVYQTIHPDFTKIWDGNGYTVVPMKYEDIKTLIIDAQQKVGV